MGLVNLRRVGHRLDEDGGIEPGRARRRENHPLAPRQQIDRGGALPHAAGGAHHHGLAGGLGIVEASLSGLLILAGVHPGEAFLATLAYRVASYWLPLLTGLPAYLLFHRRYGRPAAGPAGSRDGHATGACGLG